MTAVVGTEILQCRGQISASMCGDVPPGAEVQEQADEGDVSRRVWNPPCRDAAPG